MGLEVLSGIVKTSHSVGYREAHIELHGQNRVIHLATSESWHINPNDLIVLCGKQIQSTGIFEAFAYRNHSKGVVGSISPQGASLESDVGLVLAVVFGPLAVAFVQSWLPLLFISPIGIRMMIRGTINARELKRARKLVCETFPRHKDEGVSAQSARMIP